RSHGRDPFHLPSLVLRSAICASSSLALATLLASVADILASSAAALARPSCRTAWSTSPPLMRFWALARYFSAWASRSLDPAKFAAPAAFAASMADVAAFSFGLGSTVEQPTAAAPNAITATIRRIGESSRRRVVPAQFRSPLDGAAPAPGDGFETTTVVAAPVGPDIAPAEPAKGCPPPP